MVYAAPILASRELPFDNTAIEIQSRLFFGHELSLVTTLAKAGRMGAENNC